jgi:hypothetical protein
LEKVRVRAVRCHQRIASAKVIGIDMLCFLIAPLDNEEMLIDAIWRAFCRAFWPFRPTSGITQTRVHPSDLVPRLPEPPSGRADGKQV